MLASTNERGARASCRSSVLREFAVDVPADPSSPGVRPPYLGPQAEWGHEALSDVKRIGYGAMRLTGPGIMGPPADPDEARRVLQRAIELGVDHIDTSDYYGPYVVNDLIRESLHPYPPELVLVTKVGARRTTTAPGSRRSRPTRSSRRSTTTSAGWASSGSAG